MITDRELARYISNNLHLYLADEDKPVECKVVDVSKNNGGTVAGVQILMHGVDPVSYTHLDVYKRQV